jgi:hypothetical protein
MTADKRNDLINNITKQESTEKSTYMENFSPSPDICKKLMKQDDIKDDDEVFGSDYMLSDSEILDFSEGADS